MVKGFREIFSTTKDVVIERMKSPLISSFSIAWGIFNWKIVLILLFSDKPVEDKIFAIDQFTNFYSSLIFPFLVAIFYAAIYPLINYLIFIAHHRFEKKVEILRTESAIEVLNLKIDQVNLENRLEKSRFNAQRELEREKLENEHDLEQKRIEYQMKRLELDNRMLQKHKAAVEQSPQ